MKDIDFDELDRAVSSVMNSDEIAPQVSSDAPVTDSSPIVTPVLPSSTPTVTPAVRRSGRFMDVVHPSSDMTRTVAAGRIVPPRTPQLHDMVAAPAVTVADQPVSIEEPAEPAPLETLAVTSEKVIPAPEFIVPDEPEPAVPVSSDDTQWESLLAQAESEKENDTEAVPTEAAYDEPLASPFLSDAKVDKRPLGSYQSDESLTQIDAVLSDDTATELQMPPVPISRELTDDILAIEAADAPDAVVEAPVTPPSATVVASAPTAELLPGSIPQQYHEEPNSGDAVSGVLYDTDSYHKPLEHPAESKSGWSIALWILLFIVLGCALGVAYYFFSTGGKI